MRRHRVGVVGIVFSIAIFCGLSAAAEPVALSVKQADNPLIINGFLDGKTTSFSGIAEVTASGDVKDGTLIVSRSDLVSTTQPALGIPRGDIVIEPVKLEAGKPREV